jgi:hypothetical protein
MVAAEDLAMFNSLNKRVLRMQSLILMINRLVIPLFQLPFTLRKMKERLKVKSLQTCL